MFRFAPPTYLISVLCVCGCSFETGGVGGETDAGTTGEETSGQATEAPQTPSGSTSSTGESASGTGTDPASESMSGSSTSTSTTTDDPGTDDSSGGPPSEPRSCEELLMADRNAPSGPYLVADAADRPLSIYCDMETAGGGWTLVARSVPGGVTGGGFGWQSNRGAINSPDQPYSLDTALAGIEFTEVLLGNRSQGYAWGENVYRLDVPNDFLSNTENSVPVSGLTTVAGNCNPGGGPEMLRNAGFTGRDDVFWFRDEVTFQRYGLRPNGFDLFYDFTFPCDRGAEISGDSGMIFVR